MIGERPHVAILGAGPAGLDAALEAAERAWGFTLYEAADRPAGGVRSWGHVSLFSSWAIDASPRMRAALGNGRSGDGVPDTDACPTGRELAETLLDRVAALPAVAPHLRLGTRVLAVGREGLVKNEEISTPGRAGRPFRLLVAGPDGRERIERADAVLDCTGSLAHPNALGDGGIPAPGEAALSDRIVRRIPDVAGDPAPWAGRATLLVGDGHSAQTAARDLARLAAEAPGTKVVWAVKSAAPAWRIPDDPLPARDRLATDAEELLRGTSPAVAARLGTVVESLDAADGRVVATLRRADGPGGGRTERVEADRVLALTGSVGDHALYRQLQVHECYATAAPMKLSAALLAAGGAGADCMSQTGHGADTLVNPEPRFFILGAKSYGRNSAYLMRIGWQQVDDAFGVLAESFGA